MDFVIALIFALVVIWLAAGFAMRRFGLDHRRGPLAGFVVAAAFTALRTGFAGDDLVELLAAYAIAAAALSAWWGRQAAKTEAAGQSARAPTERRPG